MSTKSIAQKLLIKPDSTLWLSHPDRLDLLGPLPSGVCVVDRLAETGAAVVFGEDAKSLREIVAAHGEDLRTPELVWVAYPKGNRTDINRDTLWPILAEYGMRPIAQAALTEVWSGLRFRPLKPGEERSGGRWKQT